MPQITIDLEKLGAALDALGAQTQKAEEAYFQTHSQEEVIAHFEGRILGAHDAGVQNGMRMLAAAIMGVAQR